MDKQASSLVVPIYPLRTDVRAWDRSPPMSRESKVGVAPFPERGEGAYWREHVEPEPRPRRDDADPARTAPHRSAQQRAEARDARAGEQAEQLEAGTRDHHRDVAEDGDVVAAHCRNRNQPTA